MHIQFEDMVTQQFKFSPPENSTNQLKLLEVLTCGCGRSRDGYQQLAGIDTCTCSLITASFHLLVVNLKPENHRNEQAYI